MNDLKNHSFRVTKTKRMGFHRQMWQSEADFGNTA